MKLGYIGLGNMGGALARRLMREHPLRAFDLLPEVLGRLPRPARCRPKAPRRSPAKAT